MAKEEYPIKLTWGKTWVLLGIGLGIVGSIFTAGGIARDKYCEMQIADLEAKQIEKIKEINGTLGVKLLSAELDRDFFKAEYRKANSRLTICLKKGEFTDFMEKALSDNDKEN